jgi:phosphopentomutase
VLGNVAASGTEIIERLGPEHLESGDLILYTSADSVFQIAAHEDVVPVPELYTISETARRLADPYRIGRVIARPFVGTPGSFKRTYNRKDFAMAPPAPTVLDRLAEAGIATVGVGKIGDIFSGRGIGESHHTEGDADGISVTGRVLDTLKCGFCFVNLVDLDMVYGHRRDVPGYARALALIDDRLPELLDRLGGDDLLLISADHGTDPTFPGSDHTREDVPIVAWGRGAAGRELGVRDGFWDLGATVAEAFGVEPPGGKSFLAEIS